MAGKPVIAQVLPPSRESITPPQSPELATSHVTPISDEVAAPQPARTVPAKAVDIAETEVQVTGAASSIWVQRGSGAAVTSSVRQIPPLAVARSHSVPLMCTAASAAPAEAIPPSPSS